MKTYRTVKAIIEDKDGNFLLLRRSKTHPDQALQMDLPGGIIDGDEQPLEALRREITEETALDIDDLQLVYAETEEHSDKSAVRLVYAAKLADAQPAITLSWEHDQAVWVPGQEVLEMLPAKNYKRRAFEYVLTHSILQDL